MTMGNEEPKKTTTAVQSKTIQGIIIAAVCTLIGIIANAKGIEYDSASTGQIITQIVENISAGVGALIGLYLAWKGRYNASIKPIEQKKKGF